MNGNETTIQVELTGKRPLMFDRYAGDNNTQLPVEEKMYFAGDGRSLIIPSINVYSMLVAQNTQSVCRQFFGRQGKTIGLGIASYTTIEPFDISILDDNGPMVFDGFNDQITVRRDVARLAKGIPNPKERPTIAMPWRLEFTVFYERNDACSLENLRQAFVMGGTLGLGTFRPFFGRYAVTKWAES